MRIFIFSLVFLSGFYGQAQDFDCPVRVCDSDFVPVRDFSHDFIFDMKYATQDNFLNAKVYDCAECYLRLATVQALVKANKAFMKKGYRIKLFDCYRPLTIQKRMFAIVPNPKYVADPAKGSIHNRGGAVDITLVDTAGKELDMGTKFDHFGPEAAHGFAGVSSKVKKNRELLKKIMQKYGFNAFDSEWWHYNFSGATKFPVADFVWECP